MVNRKKKPVTRALFHLDTCFPSPSLWHLYFESLNVYVVKDALSAHFSRDVNAVSCHGVICRLLSHRPVWNAEWKRRKLRRDTAGFLCPEQGWCFSTSSWRPCQTVRLLIPSACDIIGSWAPALHKHAGELGRMWLKLWSACHRSAREKRGMDEHRPAIVQAKLDCGEVTPQVHHLTRLWYPSVHLSPGRCRELSPRQTCSRFSSYVFDFVIGSFEEIIPWNGSFLIWNSRNDGMNDGWF